MYCVPVNSTPHNVIYVLEVMFLESYIFIIMSQGFLASGWLAEINRFTIFCVVLQKVI